MRITEKSKRTAQKIVTVLVEEKCTVSEAKEIFRFVSSLIESETTVQDVREQIKAYLSIN